MHCLTGETIGAKIIGIRSRKNKRKYLPDNQALMRIRILDHRQIEPLSFIFLISEMKMLKPSLHLAVDKKIGGED